MEATQASAIKLSSSSEDKFHLGGKIVNLLLRVWWVYCQIIPFLAVIGTGIPADILLGWEFCHSSNSANLDQLYHIKNW